MALRIQEGFVSFRNFRTWYRIIGNLDKRADGVLPLLCLHDGTDGSHESLAPLASLAEGGRPIIFYDQLGCGRSDRPRMPGYRTMDLLLDELATVRQALTLDQVHLLGHSWGGALALAHSLAPSEGIASLVLSSTIADGNLLANDRLRFRKRAMPDLHAMLLQYEERGDWFNPGYRRARREFDRQHLCRLDPWPTFLEQAQEQASWGASMGPIPQWKSWNVRPRLPEIQLPTLVTAGRHDGYVPPVQAQLLCEGLANVMLVFFENSAHYPCIEETVTYGGVLESFMRQAERAWRINRIGKL